MLAGLPRPYAELLREAGVPATSLPRIALTASGTGRFVLFDSRISASASQARRAKGQGLDPIDIAGFAPQWATGLQKSTDHTATLSRQRFLEQLKRELEIRGGVWMRLADCPFPYQSVCCLAIQHSSHTAVDWIADSERLPRSTTHFVSSHLSAGELAALATVGVPNLGWRIEAQDSRHSSREMLSQWATDMERFQAHALTVCGVSPVDESHTLPEASFLRQLGLTYALEQGLASACRTETETADKDERWLRIQSQTLASLGTVPRSTTLPPAVHSRTTTDSQQRIDSAHVFGERSDSPFPASFANWTIEWVREHYQAGSPLFIQALVDQEPQMQALANLASSVRRCSLMWQPSLAEFASWWKLRRQLSFQAWQTPEGCEIHIPAEEPAGLWAVEIWRGNHFTTVPLRQPILHIRNDGLVYVRAESKSPCGFCIPRPAPAVVESQPLPDRVVAS